MGLVLVRHSQTNEPNRALHGAPDRRRPLDPERTSGRPQPSLRGSTRSNARDRAHLHRRAAPHTGRRRTDPPHLAPPRRPRRPPDPHDRRHQHPTKGRLQNALPRTAQTRSTSTQSRSPHSKARRVCTSPHRRRSTARLSSTSRSRCARRQTVSRGFEPLGLQPGPGASIVPYMSATGQASTTSPGLAGTSLAIATASSRPAHSTR